MRWELSGMGIVRDGNCPGWELSTWWELSGMELSGMGIVRPDFNLRFSEIAADEYTHLPDVR